MVETKLNDERYVHALERSQTNIRDAIDFLRKQIPHNGEMGAEIEVVFRSELRKLLPTRFGVANGFVVDSKGGTSLQMDIIIYDALNTSPVLLGDGIVQLPAECVYAAGEVKTNLNSSALKDSYSKCASFKKLDRSAKFDPYKECDNNLEKPWKPLFFILGGETDSLETFERTNNEITDKLINIHDCPNIIMSFDPYGSDQTNPERYCCAMMHFEKDHTIEAASGSVPKQVSIFPILDEMNGKYVFGSYKAARPWALFFMLLSTTLTQYPMTYVNMQKYLPKMTF